MTCPTCGGEFSNEFQVQCPWCGDILDESSRSSQHACDVSQILTM